MSQKEKIESSNDEVVNLNADGSVDSTLAQEPIQEIPLDEIVLNLGFWLEMAQRQGKLIAMRKFNAMPKSEQD